MEHEFSLSTVCVMPSLTRTLTIWSSLVWPFVAAGVMPARGRSPEPIAAMLVPLSLSLAGVFLELSNVLRTMPLAVPRGNAVAAGIAESLALLRVAAFSAWVTLVFAAMRRHRAQLDRMTASLFAIVAIGVVPALAGVLGMRWHLYALMVATALAGTVTGIAAIWSFLTGRGRVVSRALPYGVPAATLVCLLLAAAVWQAGHHYRDLALHGWR